MNPRKIRTRTVQFLQYLVFRVLCFFLNLLPFRFALKLGRWSGRALYRILPRYRKVALENLKYAFEGQKSEREIKQIALQSFENLGMFGMELIRIPKIVKRLEDYVAIQNVESVLKALEAKKGVVLIVSHFGNWEWMALAAGQKARERGVSISAVARTLGNPWIYDYAKRLRGATGLITLDKHGAVRKAIKLLEQNQIVTFPIDQHERHGSVPVPYFGREAWTTSVPAMLAVKKGAAVISVFSYRRKNKPTLVELGEPHPVIQTGCYEQDLIANTRQYVEALETAVRKRPGDWLWMHARWRSSRIGKVI
ncbi:MAG: lysophospholipid acyltransferase family protein [Candidatus Omnitrophica bacterium]|nr:lysophospholipid acyltransferase family protein [Candidatus Omnitrophota bacterium]